MQPDKLLVARLGTGKAATLTMLLGHGFLKAAGSVPIGTCSISHSFRWAEYSAALAEARRIRPIASSGLPGGPVGGGGVAAGPLPGGGRGGGGGGRGGGGGGGGGA